jgi:alginate O-acetyltransferase complex protein AlgI
VWGAYHGLFLVLDRIFLQKLLDKIGKIPSTIFTFFVASIGWVFFRSESLEFALGFLKNLFSFDFSNTVYMYNNFWFALVIAAIFAFLTAFGFGKKFEIKILYSEYSTTTYIIMFGLTGILFFLSLSAILASGFNPFIYFRF